MVNSSTLRVLDIVDGTTVDGVGLRTSIYFAGCSHHCPECHNPESWDHAGGVEMTVDEIVEHVVEQDFNVTFSGGDPLYQTDALIELARRVKALGKTIWCYTGFTYEEVASSPSMNRLLPFIDVLVDGLFIIEQRDISLRFRGSHNQRLVDVRRSSPGCVVTVDME